MSSEPYPVINVIVTPNKVHRGQLLSIQAYVIDRNTSTPMTFDALYMQIINEDGVEVWPLSTIIEESAAISKLISTAEMDEGKKYTVRISPSRKLRPIGTATFEIERELLPVGLLVPGMALIPHLLLSHPEDRKSEKVLSDVIEPQEPDFKIAWLIFRTQKDIRVCKFCKEYEDQRFRPDDPNLPMIPIHLKCRCHFDVISEDYARRLYIETYYGQYLPQMIFMRGYEAYIAARTVWESN